MTFQNIFYNTYDMDVKVFYDRRSIIAAYGREPEHLDGKYRAWFFYEPIGRTTLTVHCRPCNESRAFPRALI